MYAFSDVRKDGREDTVIFSPTKSKRFPYCANNFRRDLFYVLWTGSRKLISHIIQLHHSSIKKWHKRRDKGRGKKMKRVGEGRGHSYMWLCLKRIRNTCNSTKVRTQPISQNITGWLWCCNLIFWQFFFPRKKSLNAISTQYSF